MSTTPEVAAKSEIDLKNLLAWGAVAGLVAGMLGTASASLSLLGWKTEGFTVPEMLNIAALLCLVVVLTAYCQLSYGVQSPGLRKSALGLFGMWTLLEIASLNTSEEMHWWNIVVWGLIVLAGGFLVFLVVMLDEIEKEDAPKESLASVTPNTETKTPPAESKSTGWLGAIFAGLGGLLLLVLKVLGKVGSRWLLKSMDLNLAEALIMFTLLLGFVVFLVWFALVKIRLGTTLGTLALPTGLLELLLIGLSFCGFGLMALEMVQAFRQSGLDEKALTEGFERVSAVWTRRFDVASLVVCPLWALLTAGIFWQYRSRLATLPAT